MSGLLNHARRIHAIFTWHCFNVGSEHTFILSFLDAYSYPSLTNKRLCCGSAYFIQKHKLLICCNQITYYLNSFPLYCQVYLKQNKEPFEKILKDISPKKVKEKKGDFLYKSSFAEIRLMTCPFMGSRHAPFKNIGQCS